LYAWLGSERCEISYRVSPTLHHQKLLGLLELFFQRRPWSFENAPRNYVGFRRQDPFYPAATRCSFIQVTPPRERVRTTKSPPASSFLAELSVLRRALKVPGIYATPERSDAHQTLSYRGLYLYLALPLLLNLTSSRSKNSGISHLVIFVSQNARALHRDSVSITVRMVSRGVPHQRPPGQPQNNVTPEVCSHQCLRPTITAEEHPGRR